MAQFTGKPGVAGFNFYSCEHRICQLGRDARVYLAVVVGSHAIFSGAAARAEATAHSAASAADASKSGRK